LYLIESNQIYDLIFAAPSLIEPSLLLQEASEIAETNQRAFMVRPELGFEAISRSPAQRLSLRTNCGGQMLGAPPLLFRYI
jgi:hypothetical protein